MFRQATRSQSKLRMTIDGPAGSGKTFTALRFGHALGGRIAYIDTERGSASKYAGESPDGIPWDFDVVELTSFSPERYTEMIQMAGKMGYNVLIIDSLSHAWEGEGGALALKDQVSKGRDNDYTAWRKITPIHNRMIDAILQSPCHVITTMRSRMEYVQDTNEYGKVVGIRKVGLAPIQRPGMEYEFDLVCDMDWAHIMMVNKSRCAAVADLRIERPGPAFMQPVMQWLTSGTVTLPPTSEAPSAPATSPAETTIPITLEMLVDTFGPEAVLEANGGRLPADDAEVLGIAKALGVA